MAKIKPKTLSEEEQNELFKVYYETKDPEIKKQLIESNIPLVYNFSAKYKSSVRLGIDREDIVSIGTLGLIKAVERFDPYKGFVFCTYAVHCIISEINKELRKFKSLKRCADVISYDAEISYTKNSDKSLTILDTLKSDYDVEDICEEKFLIPRMMKELDNLPDKEKAILSKRFLDENENLQSEIAKELGLSQPQVSRLEKKALKNLKTALHLDEREREREREK